MNLIRKQILKFLDDFSANQSAGGVPLNTFINIYSEYFPYSDGWNDPAKRKEVDDEMNKMAEEGIIKIIKSSIGDLIKYPC